MKRTKILSWQTEWYEATTKKKPELKHYRRTYIKKIKVIINILPYSLIIIGRIDAEGETPILWPPDAKSWLIGKDLNAGKDSRNCVCVCVYNTQ